MNTPTVSSRSFTSRLFSARNLRRGLLALGVLVTAIALFYTEENWRGERAWKQVKQEAAARGVVAEWKAVIPPPVPDDQNFFAAPNMQRWFTGRGFNDFSRRMDYSNLDEFMLRRGLVPAADITVVPANATVAPGDADLVLQYNPPLLSPANPAPASDYRMGPMKQHHVEIASAAVKQMFDLIQPRLAALNEIKFSPLVHDVNLRPIGLGPLPSITPLRIIVLTDSHPSADGIKDFIPAKFVNASPAGYGKGVITNADNSFRVALGAAPYAPAADFLAWSDSFQGDFTALDAALERPYARIGGNYEHPATISIPNFVCARYTAQVLALRTQCYLLLGEPDKALHELTILHHMARMFEGRPTSQPMTLVAAMINVAVKGLYVTVIGDGLRLHAWQEPQLALIQQQLAETDLLPFVHDAFELESMNLGWDVETSRTADIGDLFFSGRGMSFWQKMREPVYMYCRFAPRGWLYQNAVVCSHLKQNMLGGFDLTNQTMQPRKIDAWLRETNQRLRHTTPYSFIADRSVPNYSRALQTAAKNQTLVNEACVVCALERYRLVHGSYPDTLDALVPQFADKLPHDLFGGDALKYRLDGAQFVLYSVGWNEKDDGGIPALQDNGKNDLSGDLTQNDWVWPYQVLAGK